MTLRLRWTLNYRTYLYLPFILCILLRLPPLLVAMELLLNLQQRLALGLRDDQRDEDHAEEAANGEPAEGRVDPAKVGDHLVHLGDDESQQGGDQIGQRHGGAFDVRWE